MPIAGFYYDTYNCSATKLTAAGGWARRSIHIEGRGAALVWNYGNRADSSFVRMTEAQSYQIWLFSMLGRVQKVISCDDFSQSRNIPYICHCCFDAPFHPSWFRVVTAFRFKKVEEKSNMMENFEIGYYVASTINIYRTTEKSFSQSWFFKDCFMIHNLFSSYFLYQREMTCIDWLNCTPIILCFISLWKSSFGLRNFHRSCNNFILQFFHDYLNKGFETHSI